MTNTAKLTETDPRETAMNGIIAAMERDNYTLAYQLAGSAAKYVFDFLPEDVEEGANSLYHMAGAALRARRDPDSRYDV